MKYAKQCPKCGSCGYSEEWIRREDIPRLRESRHARKPN